MDLDFALEHLPRLLKAAKLTIELTLLSLFFGIFVGVFFAIVFLRALINLPSLSERIMASLINKELIVFPAKIDCVEITENKSTPINIATLCFN